MKLLILPLILLIFSAMLSLALMVSGSSGFDAGSEFESSDSYSAGGNHSLDGEESSLSTEEASFTVSMTLGAGVFAWVATSAAFAGIVGIQVLGSGLAEFSVMAIVRFASLYGIWLGFSVLASPLFLSVPFFGLPLYFALTFFYSAGIIMGGSGMVGGG